MILTACPNPSVDKFLSLSSIKPGQVNRSTGEAAFPGGKGVHVALAVNELGVASHLAGFWGGPTGQWIKQMCSRQGIDSSGPAIDGWTRTCLTIRSGKELKDTEILEHGPTVTERDLHHFWEAVDQKAGQTNLICVSGSWPDGSPDQVYQSLGTYCEDPRFSVWIDASGDRLKQAIDIHPYGIHVNTTEARSLLGREDTADNYARALLDYCEVAAVTDGADGLYLASGDGVYHAYCPVEKVISTVGCGDCLLAGLLVGQHKGASLREMAVLGTACGAANCLRPDLGMLYRSDVDDLRKKVTCNKI
ncbi:1-phosphofructokinase/tagatose 6-phosphate kinase [Fodinibius roseus]|uniref:1-phosphofructokinase/tagatose 6-phosphate kinase n=1 Tax=Fodinibius roseus TaxID=1194090 RepID=A0A1M5JL95_9BACT|nr:1-phosphofructokinase family hexose kinase [Fodinibius roseus]SHG40793.1 1-phosphofructokinase/tagatose 6-phosphate kinase [Fodinibius roseus]